MDRQHLITTTPACTRVATAGIPPTPSEPARITATSHGSIRLLKHRRGAGLSHGDQVVAGHAAAADRGRDIPASAATPILGLMIGIALD